METKAKNPSENLWLLLAVEVLMLILVIWSITDAARTAKRT